MCICTSQISIDKTKTRVQSTATATSGRFLSSLECTPAIHNELVPCMVTAIRNTLQDTSEYRTKGRGGGRIPVGHHRVQVCINEFFFL